MADKDQPGAGARPETADGKSGLQGGYGSDTGFASDQGQRASGQVQDSADGGDVLKDGEGDLDGDPDDPRAIGAVSATDLRAGSSTGGSASGAEDRSNPDDKLRDERHEAVPNGATASKVAADVTEDIGGVTGEERSFGGQGAQSGGVSSQPGTGAKRLATDEAEDAGQLDRGERHFGDDRDPKENTGHPNAQHRGSAF